jgi:glucose/arabinose dehydrogenase
MLSFVLSCAQPTLSATPVVSPALAIQLEPVAQGFSQVTDIQFPPGSSTQMVVLQKTGTAWVQTLGSGERRKLATFDVVTQSELGLLGLAFHPKFPADPRVFVNYTVKGPVSRISELTIDPVAWTVKNERILMTVDQPYVNHDAGQVAFGPDGFLYIGWGDGGSGGDPHGNGQDLKTLLGSMLRIDIDRKDGDRPYGIPADNPFAVGGGAPEIFIIGLRNPWRWSFDRATGDMWIGDVGQNMIEELDVLPAGQQAGKNLGWSMYEASSCYKPPCDPTGMTMPLDERNHTTSGWNAIIGGQVYRGPCYPDLVGTYFYTDNHISGLSKAVLGSDMKLTITDLTGTFPSRSYDATRRAVRFWGHDGPMEAAFFVNEDALSLTLANSEQAYRPRGMRNMGSLSTTS